MSDSDEEQLTDPPPLDRARLEALVGTKVTDITLYQRAFTHKSALKRCDASSAFVASTSRHSIASRRRYTLDKTYETLEFMGADVFVVSTHPPRSRSITSQVTRCWVSSSPRCFSTSTNRDRRVS